jgi:WD40-like Beta Propeller Repeat
VDVSSIRRTVAPALVLACLASAACSFIISTDGLAGDPADGGGADTDPRPGEAGSDAGSDAKPPPACDLGKPFVAAILVPGVNTVAQDEARARLTADERTIYFSRNVGLSQIFVSHRASTTAPFGTATAVPELASAFEDDGATVTGDGLTMFVASTRAKPDGGSLDLFVATRGTPTGMFDAPRLIPSVSSTADDVHPYVRADGTELWFSSDRTGTAGVRDIYRAALAADGTVGPPARVVELATALEDSSPVISDDGLVLYFGSERAGGSGSRDIWIARRASPTEAFGTPTNVAELNTDSDDIPTWLSADQCRLYLTSGRINGTPRDIFFATRGK